MKQITTVGVDLAKDVIVVCAADASGRTMFFKQLGFRGFAEWAVNLSPCTIAMEACSSAHFWARTLETLGHRPKLLLEALSNTCILRPSENSPDTLSAKHQPNRDGKLNELG